MELTGPRQALTGALGSGAWSWLGRPRTRGRLLAGFLVANLVLAAPWTIFAQRGLPVGNALTLDSEGSPVNVYAGILWAVVAALAVAQVLRPAASARGPRWLVALGWLGAASLAALVAFEELASLKDPLRRMDGPYAFLELLNLTGLPPNVLWVPVVAPIAVPLAVAAGWVLYMSLRHRPMLAVLTVLAVALGASAVLRDALGDGHYPSLHWLHFLEEGCELMASAAMVVVFVELLAARPETAREVPATAAGRVGGRRAALAVTVALLATSTFALLVEYERKTWVTDLAWSYTGPISAVEQRFRATHDNLSRVTVWAYVDSAEGVEPAPAEAFARLTPAIGWSPGPIRESRATVSGARFSNSTVDFDFPPIPDSEGKLYTLAIGLMSGQESFVFLGLTGVDVNPEGEVLISGAPTGYGDDLALRTQWTGQDGLLYPGQSFTHSGPKYWTSQGVFLVGELLPNWLLLVDGAMTGFVWSFMIAAAWGGSSGGPPRMWRDYLRRTLRRSALIVASLAAIAIALLPVFAAIPRPEGP